MNVIEVEKHEEAKVIRIIANNLHLMVVPEIKRATLAELKDKTKNIVFDLSKVEYVDSSGIGLIMGIRNQLMKTDGRVLLAGLSSPVLGALRLAHLDKIVTFHDDVEAALKDIS